MLNVLDVRLKGLCSDLSWLTVLCSRERYLMFGAASLELGLYKGAGRLSQRLPVKILGVACDGVLSRPRGFT